VRPVTDSPTSITNCHIHTFTHKHTPARFVPWPINDLIRIGFLRHFLIWLAKRIDSGRRTRFGRYAQIIETSYRRSQVEIFEIVRGFYPEDTRFVLLPMDMERMGAGMVEEPIDTQHAQIKELCSRHQGRIIPFAAVDPRQDNVVAKTIRLLEDDGFRGIKLYPPTGYHPNDPELAPLYAYAAEHGIPVLTPLLTSRKRPVSRSANGEDADRPAHRSASRFGT